MHDRSGGVVGTTRRNPGLNDEPAWPKPAVRSAKQKAAAAASSAPCENPAWKTRLMSKRPGSPPKKSRTDRTYARSGAAQSAAPPADTMFHVYVAFPLTRRSADVHTSATPLRAATPFIASTQNRVPLEPLP